MAAAKKPVKRTARPKQASRKQPIHETITVATKLPSAWLLVKTVTSQLQRHYQLLGTITVINAMLYAVLVQALGHVDVAHVRSQVGNAGLGNALAFSQLLSGSNSGAGQAYELMLFFVGSLALVWALRKIQDDVLIKARDAFYKGMYPLVPVVLVSLLAVLQLLPLIIGAYLYQLVTVTGVASNSLQVALWGLIAAGSALLTAYFLVGTIQAFYIATLPNVRPLSALRTAKQLVRGRRWTILRKTLVLPLFLLVLYVALLLPVVIVLPAAAPWMLVILVAASLTVSHVYLYNLYRSLLNE